MLIKRVMAGITSNLFFQGISAVIQLFGVPLCLAYWGESYYGEWLLLFTIPGYLSISDFGLGVSSATEMSMMEQDNRRDEIQHLLRSVFWFIVLWGALPFGLLMASNYIWPWYSWLKLEFIKEPEFRATFPVLILYIYVSLFLTVPLNYYRVIKKYYIERYISTVYKVIEFLILLVLVMKGFGVFSVALGYLLVRIAYLFYIIFDLYYRSDLFRLFPVAVRFSEVKKVLKPGISGLFYLLGSNMLNQGLSTIVGLNFGPQKLVMFSTVRMLINLSKQMIGIINLSVYAEFSYAFGAGKRILLQNLLRTSIVINVVFSAMICIFLWFMGGLIIGWWTKGIVQVDTTFFTLYLVYAFLGSLSAPGSTVLSATNSFRHTGLVYLIVITCVIGINALWINQFGLSFMAITLIFFEMLLVFVIFKVIAGMLDLRFMEIFRNMSVRDIFPSQLKQKWEESGDHS